MICEHCQASVNVPMHNGATLRCPCGKTMLAAGSQPDGEFCGEHGCGYAVCHPAHEIPHMYYLPPGHKSFDPRKPELPAMLKLMRENKALRVRSGELEVELHPDAFAPAWSAQNSTLDATEKPCRCGHSVPVQHNPEGQCLEGCEPDACAEKAAA